jgi:hypothetical protein
VKLRERACMVTWWPAACAALVAGTPAPAGACSGAGCVDAEFFPARGTVPANLPAVLFWPPSRLNDEAAAAGPDSGAPGDVRFVRLDAAGPVEVAFELVPSHEPSTRRLAGSTDAPAYRIVPATELQPGARYAVWARGCSGDIAAEPPREPYDHLDDPEAGHFDAVLAPQAPYAVFEASAAATLPSALGSMTISDPVRREVPLGGGSGCYELYDAASVVAAVERQGAPFFDAIAFVTYVDGEVYRPSPHLNYAPAYGDSWIGHGRDDLVALCEPGIRGPLGVGRHTLRFEGRVAGTDVMLVGETVEFELSCGESVDGGSAVAGRGSDLLDAGADGTDGGPGVLDVGSRSRTSVRFGDDGGGCAVAGDARGSVLAVLLALAFLRRTRRSQF